MHLFDENMEHYKRDIDRLFEQLEALDLQPDASHNSEADELLLRLTQKIDALRDYLKRKREISTD